MTIVANDSLGIPSEHLKNKYYRLKDEVQWQIFSNFTKGIYDVMLKTDFKALISLNSAKSSS